MMNFSEGEEVIIINSDDSDDEEFMPDKKNTTTTKTTAENSYIQDIIKEIDILLNQYKRSSVEPKKKLAIFYALATSKHCSYIQWAVNGKDWKVYDMPALLKLLDYLFKFYCTPTKRNVKAWLSMIWKKGHDTRYNYTLWINRISNSLYKDIDINNMAISPNQGKYRNKMGVREKQQTHISNIINNFGTVLPKPYPYYQIDVSLYHDAKEFCIFIENFVESLSTL